MKKLYPASEIAALGLPGLPTSKAAIIARAKAEGWRYEEQKALGGTRRIYELPAKYLEGTSSAASQIGKVVGTIVGGSATVDAELMRVVVHALRKFARERHYEIPEDREAALIAVLYNYIAKGATDDEINQLLKAVVM